MQNLKTTGKVISLLVHFNAVHAVLASHNADVYDIILLGHRKCTDFVMPYTSVSNPLSVVSIIYGLFEFTV